VAAAAADLHLPGAQRESMSMETLDRTVRRIAPTTMPVLLVGECGTGKAFVAQRIHQLSLRHTEPMVRTICFGLAPESAGAYFSNPISHNGNGRTIGTLFLKEISELSSVSQRSLLYSIPEGDSIGNEDSGNPRLISSTVTDLGQEVIAGRFRGELYYRLKGVCLRLRPLRERKQDLPELAELLLTKHSTLQGRPRPSLDPEDMSLLQAWNWPGNVLELENVIKQMVILNDAKSVLLELVAMPKGPRSIQPTDNSSALKAATRAASRRVEEELILDTLTKTRWNRKRAARDLKISYKSLLSKLKQIEGKPEKQ
jgi:DNA-binding NtrC family response regulator